MFFRICVYIGSSLFNRGLEFGYLEVVEVFTKYFQVVEVFK